MQSVREASPQLRSTAKKAVSAKALEDQASDVIANAFRLFKDHTERLTEDIKGFNERRREMREAIERGGRRTSGRIV
jgi:hypothetical protein